MREYEAMILLSSELEDEGVNAVIERLGRLLADSGGDLLSSGQLANSKGDVAEVQDGEGWKVRKLAYPIRGDSEGYYVVTRFTAEPEVPREIESRLQLDETVLRYLVVRADRHEQEL